MKIVKVNEHLYFVRHWFKWTPVYHAGEATLWVFREVLKARKK